MVGDSKEFGKGNLSSSVTRLVKVLETAICRQDKAGTRVQFDETPNNKYPHLPHEHCFIQGHHARPLCLQTATV
jgi:hypothetical protein